MRTRLRKWSLLLGAAAVLALPLTAWAQLSTFDLEKALNAESHVGNLTGHAKDAAAPYRRYCVGCHGTLGDGEGENAAWMEAPLYQKPRNFQLGVFKCRSTPTGTLPADQDLYDAITRGFDRSNMPQWNTLTKQERTDLVAWVKHFSPRFATEKPGTPITIPPEPEVTAERIKAGRDVFARVQCWKCHGVQGMANGPSASFMTGLDGTPMPSFADNIKPEEAWDLVFYLRTFMSQKSKEKELAKQLALKPVDPNAPVGQQ